MRSLRATLFGLTLAVAPLVVAAQASKPYPECKGSPTDADVSAAKGLYQAGTTSFNEADYPRAISYWEDAYARDCTAHPLLLNLARAYELNGNKAQAVECLSTYLARVASSPDRSTIERRVEVMKKQLEAAAAPAATASAGPTAAPAASAAPSAATEPEPEPEWDSSKLPAWPLFVAGGGAVVAIIGAAIYFPAAGDVDNYERQCPERVNCPVGFDFVSANDARDSASLGGILAWSGAGVGAIGLALWLALPGAYSPTAAAPTQTLVAPAVGPGFTGVSVNGAF